MSVEDELREDYLFVQETTYEDTNRICREAYLARSSKAGKECPDAIYDARTGEMVEKVEGGFSSDSEVGVWAGVDSFPLVLQA